MEAAIKVSAMLGLHCCNEIMNPAIVRGPTGREEDNARMAREVDEVSKCGAMRGNDDILLTPEPMLIQKRQARPAIEDGDRK